jgi:DNA-binding MarR family transcriptional regulator
VAPSTPDPRKPQKAPIVATLTLDDYQALGAFREALRRFLAFSEAGAEELGLTAQQHQALLAIKAFTGDEPMTVGQLANSLEIKSNSAVGLVKRLEDRRLVTREASTHDRRRALLRLTPAAEQSLEQISLKNLAQLKSSAAVFTELLATLHGLEDHGPATA